MKIMVLHNDTNIGVIKTINKLENENKKYKYEVIRMMLNKSAADNIFNSGCYTYLAQHQPFHIEAIDDNGTNTKFKNVWLNTTKYVYTFSNEWIIFDYVIIDCESAVCQSGQTT